MVKVIVAKIRKIRDDIGTKSIIKFIKYLSILAILYFIMWYFVESNYFDSIRLTIGGIICVIILVIHYRIEKESENTKEYKLLKELEEQVATSGIDKN